MLDDQRPKAYPEGGGQRSASAAFTGDGQTLGGKKAKQRQKQQRDKVTSLTAKASLDDGVIEWAFATLLALFAWLIALPQTVLDIGGVAAPTEPTRYVPSTWDRCTECD